MREAIRGKGTGEVLQSALPMPGLRTCDTAGDGGIADDVAGEGGDSMTITETVCRSIIKLEAADLNGSLYERQLYTQSARCWAGDLAREWIASEKEKAELRLQIKEICGRLS